MASSRYSLGTCVAETAARLVSTAGDDSSIELLRRLGLALRGAEALSFTQVAEHLKRRGTQGLELRLGFYDEPDRTLIESEVDLVALELSRTLGGFSGAIQLKCVDLAESGAWLGSKVQWPTGNPPSQHLHRYVLAYRDEPAPGREPDHLHDAEWLIVARRLRFRLGVDHANGQPDALWWTTAQTHDWLRALVKDGRSVNYFVSGILRKPLGQPISADPADNHADDWGCISLSEDPLRVITVGPRTSVAETHSDVATTLARAGSQISVSRRNLRWSESAYPLADYARALRDIAGAPDVLNDVDVVVAYRGGGLEVVGPDGVSRTGRERGLIDDNSRAELVAAVNELGAVGVEVVLGIGHGTTAVYQDHQARPVGVFEAVTPTAAASWVVREHVNNRLAHGISDPGQPTHL